MTRRRYGTIGLTAVLIAMFATAPAFAGATAWQEIAPGARARLISSDSVEQGALMAGVEIDLPQGTNIYWRIPGETGLPTQIDLSGSTGVEAGELLFPYPEIDRSRGYLDYIHRGNVVLPLRVTMAAEGAMLNATLSLGVCSEICVPAQAEFSLPISATPDATQALRLQLAMARVPIAWDRPAEPLSSVGLNADASALELRGADPAVDPASLIVDVGDAAILFESPQKSPDGAIWTVRPLRPADLAGLEGRPVNLTFMTAMGPYAVSATIAAAVP